ncbi:MAG: 1,4-dihydroxy-6-naphthoate synthase [Bacteroidota bacterium]|jgi:1,4-dihydroxy-6-naphthoate synthase
MRLRIGFSPCPNDTFIFDALVNGKIDTLGIEFEPILADVEELNKMAGEGKLDITKLSIGAYPFVSNQYIILDAGSALGKGVGPLLVSKTKINKPLESELSVAIPGAWTTAHFLLSLFYPQLQNKRVALFSEIESMVQNEIVDMGLLIHEGRFTYAEKGLLMAADLGLEWEEKTRLPLPLGCICASRLLSAQTTKNVESLVRASLAYAFENRDESNGYVLKHAQEMEIDVVRKHIDLYVNEYSLSLGSEGRQAISRMLEIISDLKPEIVVTQPIFTNFAS